MKKILLPLCFVLACSGCAAFFNAPKNIAGVSRQDLEDARVNSIYQVYPCELTACFNAVIDAAQKNKYYVFTKDQARGFISLMNIPGVVDTTEVAVFLTGLPKEQGVRVELSSRSSPAKKIVAKEIFSHLGDQFKK